jgi:hypothetical protein
MAAAAVLAIMIAIQIQVFDSPSFIKPFVSGCLYMKGTNLVGGIFICPLVFESAVCLATLKKALQHCKPSHLCRIRSRNSHSQTGNSSTIQHSPLVKTLYYDGFLYFFVIFAIAATNLLVWYLVPASLGMLLIMIYRVSMCVMSSRIILHIRKAGAELGAGQSLAFRSVLAWAIGDEFIQTNPVLCAGIGEEIDDPP